MTTKPLTEPTGLSPIQRKHKSTHDLLRSGSATLNQSAAIVSVVLHRWGDSEGGELSAFVKRCRDLAEQQAERAAEIGPPSPALANWSKGDAAAKANWRPMPKEMKA